MTVRQVAAAARHAERLDRMARANARSLLALWDNLGGYSWNNADEFHAAAQPLVIGASEAAVDASATYAQIALPRSYEGAVSPLLVADNAARLYDPFDLIGHLVAQGDPRLFALQSGRSAVERLGRDSVLRSARQAIAEQVTGVTAWVRRVDRGACKWCLSLSDVVWPDAASATFGHDNCGCIPVPADAIGNHNSAVRAAAAFDDQAKAAYGQRAQVRRLERSERTARRRQAEARSEQTTEADPARKERLSVREQEWETRAERAAERRRLIETGSHRLAA